jgi:hypothetical protein
MFAQGLLCSQYRPVARPVRVGSVADIFNFLLVARAAGPPGVLAMPISKAAEVLLDISRPRLLRVSRRYEFLLLDQTFQIRLILSSFVEPHFLHA